LINLTFIPLWVPNKFFITLKGRFSSKIGIRSYNPRRRRTLTQSAPSLITHSWAFARLPLICSKLGFMKTCTLLFYTSSTNLILTLRSNYSESCLFSYTLFRLFGVFDSQFFANLRLFLGLISINTSLVSLVSYNQPLTVFASSPGSKASLINFNPTSGFYLVNLPSNKTRLFYFISTAELSKTLDLVSSRDFKYHNAGSRHSDGFKPTVRGVAKNPVDHPHGGRTKSIKLPRTPWGLVTKKK
jgi:hypothetical protein